MEKFKAGNRLKCKGDCCSCIEIIECISDNGETAEVKAVWYERRSIGWVRVSNETQFKITKRQYPLWRQIKQT